jgi:hypothetical protein
MKLSQDVIFFCLLMKYPVRYKYRNPACMAFDYPIIFDSRTGLSGHTVILCSEELDNQLLQHDSGDMLYICIGDNLCSTCEYKSSVIIVDKNVSLIRLANEVHGIFNEFNSWDESLKTVLYDSGSFQDLVNTCDTIIVEPIAITDRDFQVVAYSKMSDELGYNANVDEDKYLSLDAFKSFITQVDFARMCKNRDVFVMESMGSLALSRNIFYNNEYVGSIGIKLSTGEDYIQAFNSAILAHFHSYAERLYAKYSSFDDRESSKNILVRILEHSFNEGQLPDKAHAFVFMENNWHINDQLQLIQFFANPLQDKALYASYLRSKISKIWHNGICFTYKDYLLLLVNISHFKTDFFKTLNAFLNDNALIAGISRIFAGLACLRSAYDQTITAAETGIARDPSCSCFLFEDYVLDYMLLNAKGHYDKSDICSSKLMALIRHDAANGTNYHQTLRVYFECRFNAVKAAKRLFINRSTFHYRLDRIKEMTQIDFESSDELLYLAMSIKLQNHM